MNNKTKQLTTTAMLCAIAYIVMFAGRFLPPISTVDFFKYDPKDIVIAMGGFIFGPLTAVIMSVIVSFFEMITVSTTGPIGFVMNVVQSCTFAGVAALFYKKNHSLKGAVRGLAAGCLFSTAVMLLWNYFLTPIYMGMPREAVAEMMLPVILPFNLLKGSINMSLTILLYKHIVTALRKANLVPPSTEKRPERNYVLHILILAAILLILCAFIILKNRGVI